MQRPREARQTQEGRNLAHHEGQPHPGTPRGVEMEAKSSRAKGHGLPLTPREKGNEATLGGHVENEELRPPHQGLGERSWEQRFKSLQQELSHMKEVVKGELLTLYLAISDFSTSAVLVRDKDRVQHPFYYCSRALRGAEERYPRMEKLILALVTTSRKLRPYFQAHTIEVPIEYPMKQVLHKLETS